MIDSDTSPASQGISEIVFTSDIGTMISIPVMALDSLSSLTIPADPHQLNGAKYSYTVSKIDTEKQPKHC